MTTFSRINIYTYMFFIILTFFITSSKKSYIPWAIVCSGTKTQCSNTLLSTATGTFTPLHVYVYYQRLQDWYVACLVPLRNVLGYLLSSIQPIQNWWSFDNSMVAHANSLTLSYSVLCHTWKSSIHKQPRRNHWVHFSTVLIIGNSPSCRKQHGWKLTHLLPTLTHIHC